MAGRPLTSENLQKNNDSLTTTESSSGNTLYNSGSTFNSSSTPDTSNKATVKYARLNWSAEEDLLLLQNVISHRNKLNENGSKTKKFWELVAGIFSSSRALSRSDRQCKDRFYVLFRRPSDTYKGKDLRQIDIKIEKKLAEVRRLFAVEDGIKLLDKSSSSESSERHLYQTDEPSSLPTNSASSSGQDSDTNLKRSATDFETPLQPVPTRRKLNTGLDLSDDSSFEERQLDSSGGSSGGNIPDSSNSAMRRPGRKLSPLSEFAKSVRDASQQLQYEVNRKDGGASKNIGDSISTLRNDVEEVKDTVGDMSGSIQNMKKTILESLIALRQNLDERDQKIYEELRTIKQKMSFYPPSAAGPPPPPPQLPHPSRSSPVSYSLHKMDSNFGNFQVASAHKQDGYASSPQSQPQHQTQQQQSGATLPALLNRDDTDVRDNEKPC